ncbi:GNAT family N-acetyltransferase [Cellulomonas sp. JH27-2]|uniref:GNAT family N-acetyltransferase n=1 Tax=Cellulomonas sp. JH27-2 TaxID=2774139 RepID=UPI00178185F4|nr:GNAT family N-acetyltransferase [Cellulomonas sp. JH27-2]MBD8058392.1 GNAT family N-acetyltransferase [Cellulomonas sp. JH27-2]
MTCSLTFEPLTEADIDWAWDVYEATTREHVEPVTDWTPEHQWAERLAGLRGGSFTAIVDSGRRVGLAEVTDDGDELTIRHLEVLPAAQGRGIGSAAIEVIAARAAITGQSVSLRVLHVNPRARALYERLGFVVEDERATSTQMRLAPPLAEQEPGRRPGST